MTERDLTRDCDKADETKRPSRLAWRETDIDQIFRLMDLDGIPGKQPAKITGRQPPKSLGAERSCERPINRGPSAVDDVRGVMRPPSAASNPN